MTKEYDQHSQVAPQHPVRLPLVLWADRDIPPTQAEQLANRLQAPLVWNKPSGSSLVLRMDKNGLALGLIGAALSRYMLHADFDRMLPRLKSGGLNRELLIRAARIRHRQETQPLLAVDATAGLGEDALLLAAAGFEVQLCEHNPIIAALLEDGLRRAKEQPELAAICCRMHLHAGNSIDFLQQLRIEPDLILLDPMFPPRQKSAKVKKKLQLLQMVEQPCPNEEALVQAALAARPRKLVIKRPRKGSPLAGISPSYSLIGKAIRFDCMLVRR
ncbi:MAG: class I SAM-dependent methyltransferase [Desulfobulbus sp.]|jgi:16S rRNA (guanine1516-N2)-methyltransferase